jgi:hypothetical protein
MSKHTRGPWEARNGEVTTRQVFGRSYRRIAAVQDYGLGSLKEVDEANANLIAAAPEMLDILDRIACQFESTPDKHSVLIGYSQIIEARNIIRKARGEA